MIKKGDRVTVEGRIFGATVVSVGYGVIGDQVKIKYHCPKNGKVVRYVDRTDLRKED